MVEGITVSHSLTSTVYRIHNCTGHNLPVLNLFCTANRATISFMWIDLQNGEMWASNDRHNVTQICVCRGSVWITQTGCPDDHVLQTGVRMTPSPRGKIVVQALTDARICIEQPTAQGKLRWPMAKVAS